MAITLYSGLPGSGKSHGVVKEVIVPALEAGKRVWTNIPLKADAFHERGLPLPTAFKIDDLISNPRWFQDVFEAGAVLVVDEIWRLWPSGLKANNAIEGHKSFLAEHRHMVGEDGFSTEVVLVTQDGGQLSMFVRQLIDTTYRFVKLDKLGVSSAFTLHIFSGAVTGQNPPESKKLRTIPGKYDPEIFKLYVSHTMSQSGGAGDETATDTRNNALKGLKARSILFGLVVLPIITIIGLRSVWTHYNEPAKSKLTAAQGSQQPAPPRKPQEIGFLEGKRIRIVATLVSDAGVDVVFKIQDGNYYSRVTMSMLSNLGYSVRYYNECLAGIEGHGKKYYAQCFNEPQSTDTNLVGSVKEQFTGS